MQTRCPACQTLYRIDEDVLKRAGGQARCFRCDTVFNAYDNPASDPADADNPPAAEVEAAGTPNPVGADSLGSDSESLSDLSALTDLPDVPEADGLHGQADDQGGLDLSDLTEILGRRHAPSIDEDMTLDLGAVDDDGGDRNLDDSPGIEIPADLPDIEPAERDILSSDQVLNAPTRRHTARTLLGSVTAVLLALLALAQLAWFNQAQVLATPVGHALVQGLCSLTGCTPPPRRAPSRFTVLERNITPDPSQHGALAMRVSFRNDADFPQPLPDIQLSLYDSEEKLLARRRLRPHEYLFPAPAADTLVAAGDTVLVDLRLEDPGRRATGFKLEFL